MPIKTKAAKPKTRAVHITLEEGLLADDDKLKGVVREIEQTTGETADLTDRGLMRYGILRAKVDAKARKRLASLPGVAAVEDDEVKRATER